MSEALERLKKIGAQKIYEETHIPVEHAQAMLHESFDGFSRVQFLGFVSILEREYDEDLSEFRSLGLENFEVHRDVLEEPSVFIAPKKKKNFTLLYLVLALGLFGAVAYFQINSSKESTEVPIEDNSLIENVQNSMQSDNANESNLSTLDTNTTVLEANATRVESSEPVEEVIQEIETPQSLKFKAKTELWLGYIDVATNKHYNKIFTGEFALDTNKNWLLVFGHKFVDMTLGEKLVEVDKNDSLRFLYEDGELKAISKTEFKKLNRGRTW